MKKLLITATLGVAVAVATPLLAHQTGSNAPAQTAATESCQMTGEHGNRTEHRAAMQKRMQEMHARMGSHEGSGGEHGAGHRRNHRD